LVSELRGDFKRTGKTFQKMYVKLEADKTFSQQQPFTGYETETITAGYTLLNAGIGAEVSGANKKTLFSIFLSMNNITNQTYQNHLSRLKYTAENRLTGRRGVFNTGRNFSVKLNFPLAFKAR
jgi:iron complex outermembrane receptor protein